MNNTTKKNVQQNNLPKPRLLDFYKKNIIKEIKEEKKYSNVHCVPKITKIVITTCLGKCFRDTKTFESIRDDFENICLQKSVVFKAKQSIASFNLREGMNLGYKVTLRGNRMYYFLDRLVNLVFVLDREFKGLKSKSITGHKKSGYSISLGIEDISIFPEIEKKSLTSMAGMGITICSNGKTKEDLMNLLTKFNLPFRKGE